MKTRLFAILIIVAWSGSAVAEPAIYESHDAAGAVFSDEPSPAAQPMSLPPPSVIQTEQQSVQNKATPNAAAIYSSISIIFPADQGGVHTNTGAFDASVQIEPELQVGRGDRIRMKLDGTLLPQSYNSTNIGITEADWQNAANANPDTDSHTLQATIIDKEGNPLIESAPVTFWAHRATVR